MTWLLLALTTAFSLATADALSKRAINTGGVDDLVIVWVREGYALPFLALAFLFVPVPAVDATFWLTVAVLLPLEIAALVLYVKAIDLSPLSLSVPFLALSPVFIVVIAFVFLGERPAPLGIAGIVMITAGAYVLNAGASRHGILGPIRAIAAEPGSVIMIVVSLIYSVTSTLGKVAINHSDPVFFGFFYPFLLTIVLTVVVAWRGRLRLVAARPRVFIPIGFFTAAMVITHFLALSLTHVAYMIAVKRMSLVFSVIYGRLLFAEERIPERLVGSAVMAAGVALIAISWA